MGGEVEIGAVETLSENHYPLRRYSFALRRRDGARQELNREVYTIPGSAVVLPFDPRRSTVLLTRQFRLPAQVNGDAPRLVEACAGNMEEGDGPAETARKEAEQELGCRLRDLREVFALYMSPGATSEKLRFFTAEYDPGARTGGGGGLREEGEDIEVLELPLAEAWAMVGRGEIVDAKTVLLLQHLLLARGGEGGAAPEPRGGPAATGGADPARDRPGREDPGRESPSVAVARPAPARP